MVKFINLILVSTNDTNVNQWFYNLLLSIYVWNSTSIKFLRIAIPIHLENARIKKAMPYFLLSQSFTHMLVEAILYCIKAIT